MKNEDIKIMEIGMVTKNFPDIIHLPNLEVLIINNNCYMLTIYSFQRGVHDGTIQKFMSDCVPYYLENKQKRQLVVIGSFSMIRNIKTLSLGITSMSQTND